MRSRMIAFSSLSKASWAAALRSLGCLLLFLAGAVGRGGPVLLEDCRLHRLARVLALELVLDLSGLVQRGAVRRLHFREQPLVDGWRLDRRLVLADLLGQLALKRTDLLDRPMGDVQGVENLSL